MLPLIGIVATLTFAGDRSAELLGRGRRFLHKNWPWLLATAALVAGVFITLLGVTGFTSHGNNDFGTFSRHLRHILTHPAGS